MKINMTSKDGVTLLTKGKYCTEDIEVTPTFETGGGAKIVGLGGWKPGTKVPNSGTIENLYININLTVEEVNNIISEANLTWTQIEDMFGIYGVGLTETTGFIGIMSMTNAGVSGYAIGELMSETIIFNGIDMSTLPPDTAGELGAMFGPPGWNTAIIPDGMFPVNDEAISTLPDMGTESVGAENDKLTMIFSTTPFEMLPGETLAILEGDYDGSAITVNVNSSPIDVKVLLDNKKLPLEIEIDILGEVVPNSGYVENVYFNINLSANEVVETIAETIPITNVETGYGACYLLATESVESCILAMRSGTGTTDDPIKIAIVTGNFTGIFSTIDESINGWTSEIVNQLGCIHVNTNVLSVKDDMVVGASNDKIRKLFSITPFDILNLQSKTVTASLTEQTVIADKGYDGLYQVTVEGGIDKYTVVSNSNNTIESYAYKNLPIKHVVISEGIENIGNSAFTIGVNTLELPSTLKKLDSDSFYGSLIKNLYYNGTLEQWCDPDNISGQGSNLLANAENMYISGVLIGELLEFPENMNISSIRQYAFSEYTAIKEVIIPNGIVNIGANAFSGASNLISIQLPNTIQTIGAYAFEGSMDRGVRSVKYKGTLREWCDIDFEGSYANPTHIVRSSLIDGDSGFTSLSLLDENSNEYALEGVINIPNDIIGIKPFTFAGVSGISEVIIPETVTYIDHSAFTSSSIETITIPSTVQTICTAAFAGCNMLGTVNINSPRIDSRAFAWSGISNLNLSNTVTEIRDEAFFYCYNLTTLNIPDSVTHIGNNAFAECGSLHNITIGNGLTEIPDGCFEDCGKYDFDITLGNNITQIGKSAFAYSTVRNVTFLGSVTYIGSGAFTTCSRLEVLDFRNNTGVPVLEGIIFIAYFPDAIVVPDALYDEWIVAEWWSEYASYIIKASEYTE